MGTFTTIRKLGAALALGAATLAAQAAQAAQAGYVYDTLSVYDRSHQLIDDPNGTPEPTSIALALLALGSLVASRRRKAD